MNIVSIGGGTGLPITLRATQSLCEKQTAIVATTDDGGSTGKLRKYVDSIAWGDIRKCLCALSDDHNPLKLVINHRFDTGEQLAGHSLGNLILNALDKHCSTPTEAALMLAQMLNVTAEILPMSNESTNLVATTHCGNKVIGECAIDALQTLPQSIKYSGNIRATPETLHAIAHADLITIGPGSLITSVYPVLMLSEIQTALRNSKAEKVLLANLRAENSVVDSLTNHQAVAWIVKQVGFQFFDKIIAQKPMYRYAKHSIANLCNDNFPNLHDETKLKNALLQNTLVGRANKQKGQKYSSIANLRAV